MIKLVRRFIDYARRRGIKEALKRSKFELVRSGMGAFHDADASSRAFLYAQESVLSNWNIQNSTEKDLPTFSILMPTFRGNLKYLGEAIESILEQTYDNWELVVVDDGSDNDGVISLLQDYAEQDPRIKFHAFLQNQGISAATNQALDIATGDYICLMDHDDLIHSKALELMAAVILNSGSAWVYSDEAKINEDGTRYFDLFFKPDWSPYYLLTCMYTAHFSAYRTDLVRELRFRSSYDGAQDYDFALRLRRLILHQGLIVSHLPFLLYFWRAIPGSTALSMWEKPSSALVGLRAVEDAVYEDPLLGSVNPSHFVGSYVTQASFWESGVSIIIPTALSERDGKLMLETCLGSLTRTGLPVDSEVIVVLAKDAYLPDIKQPGYKIRFIHDTDRDVNIARKMNLGANCAVNEALVFLNDDVTLQSPNSVSSLVGYLHDETVGSVGPLLAFPNGTVQCSGVTINQDGLPDHIMRSYPVEDAGYYFSLVGTREVLSNTGAFLAVRAQDFQSLSGFNEELRINYNDIDFSLRLRDLGLQNIIACHIKAIHLESASRSPRVDYREEAIFMLAHKSRVPDTFYPSYLELRPPNYGLVLAGAQENLQRRLDLLLGISKK